MFQRMLMDYEDASKGGTSMDQRDSKGHWWLLLLALVWWVKGGAVLDISSIYDPKGASMILHINLLHGTPLAHKTSD